MKKLLTIIFSLFIIASSYAGDLTDFDIDELDGVSGISRPTTTTDNGIATWDGTTGSALQDTGVLVDDTDHMTFNNANAGAIQSEAASSTNPTFCPDKTDLDTGVGHATADAMSVVAGGVEGIRVTEAARTIESNATVCANDAGDLHISTTAVHALAVGDVVQFAAGTGALCTGISASTNYYVTAVDSTKLVNIATSRGGTNITYTDAGTAFTSYEMEVDTNIYGETIHPMGSDNGIVFGDGDTGFYETSDDFIAYKNGATGDVFYISNAAIYSVTSAGAAIYMNAATATDPPITFVGDTDTGIGKAAADQLSLIAGGVEGWRISEATTITHTVSGVIDYSTEDVTCASDACVAAVTTHATFLTSENAGGADVCSLANGVVGQVKVVVFAVDGTDDVELTPTTFANGTKITFDTAGESVVLMYVTTIGWTIIANNGGTVS